MIQTFTGYGYNLGGPGNWHLEGTAPGELLRLPWYDETDPTQDFVDALAIALASREPQSDPDAPTPLIVERVIDMSPPGWTREANAPPSPSAVLPPDSAMYDPEKRAHVRYVLIILDSVGDVDAPEDSDSEEVLELDDGVVIGFDGVVIDTDPDWDKLFYAALPELGVQVAGAPDWLWFRTETSTG